MNKYQDKLRLSLYGIFVIAALLILIDFVLPGKVVIDKVVHVEREQQQYYNAAGNYHFSYKVITNKHHFSVSGDFARMIQNNQPIEYSVSPIFRKVNRYGILPSNNKAIYSLRIISGFIIPLIVIIAIIRAIKYKTKNSTLIFVLKVIVIADLIFLII